MMLAYRITQLLSGPFCRTVWRVKVTGADAMPDGPVIAVANHESMLDPFFLGCAFERQVRYLAKEELFVGPFAPLLRSLGAIAVARGRGDREALGAGLAALDEGSVVGVFPQGTTIPRGERPWLRGAARLALATGAPILPVCLVNTEKALRPARPKIGFPSVKVLVGSPIQVEPARSTIVAARSLTERVRDVIEEMRAPYGPPAHVVLQLPAPDERG